MGKTDNIYITKDIQIIELALYLTKHKTLIIADTHIGYEESLNKQGILIPRFQFRELIFRLEGIFKKIKSLNSKNFQILNTIIINGDIKHEFGTISEQEWRHTLRLIEFLKKHCNTLILIKGNHDTILKPIAKKRNIQITDQVILDNILIAHGHRLIKPQKNIQNIIIAHEHPAITLREKTRIETFKCFLKGRYQNKILIVQPSFNLVTHGTDITKEKLISPFLKQNLNNFETWVIADKVYYFGKLKTI